MEHSREGQKVELSQESKDALVLIDEYIAQLAKIKNYLERGGDLHHDDIDLIIDRLRNESDVFLRDLKDPNINEQV